MAGIVFDSSVYVNALRKGDESIFLLRNYEDRDGQMPVWLSVVVVEELLAGAVDIKTQKLLARIQKVFESNNRLLVPNKTDWVETGKIINRFGQRFGYETVGKGRITNDVLIAMSVLRQGLTLITSNAKDFERIALIRQFNWESGN